MKEMHDPEGWVAGKLVEHQTGGHGANYHHPEAGDQGYQFYMPPGDRAAGICKAFKKDFENHC